MFQALLGPISALAGSFMQGQIEKQKAMIMIQFRSEITKNRV